MVAVISVISLAACDLFQGPSSEPTAPTLSPTVLAGTPVEPVQVVVRDSSPSARLINFQVAVAGYFRATVDDRTKVTREDGTPITLADIRPDTRVEIAGRQGSLGVIAADQVTLLGGVEPTPDCGSPDCGFPPLAALEQQVAAYFDAIGRQETARARDLMTPELQARNTDEALRASAQGVERLSVVTLQASTIEPNHVLYTVGIAVRLAPNATSPWIAGQNNRTVDMVRTPNGWRVAAVSEAPVPPPPATSTPPA